MTASARCVFLSHQAMHTALAPQTLHTGRTSGFAVLGWQSDSCVDHEAASLTCGGRWMERSG
jgi:hypothetical protein